MQDYRPPPQLTSATAGGAGTHGSLFNSVPTPDGAAASAVPAQPGAATPVARRAAGSARHGARILRGQSARGHRRARSRHQLARAARSTAPISRNIRCTRTRPTCRCASRTTTRHTLYVVQTGLTGAAGEAAPSHLATLERRRRRVYTLADGATELRVPLTWTDGHGLTVTKTFVFKRGQYADRSSLRCAQ